MIRAVDGKIVIESLSTYQTALTDDGQPSDGYRGEGSDIALAIENLLTTIVAAGKQCPYCGKGHPDNITEGVCQHCGYMLLTSDDS